MLTVTTRRCDRYQHLNEKCKIEYRIRIREVKINKHFTSKPNNTGEYNILNRVELKLTDFHVLQSRF